MGIGMGNGVLFCPLESVTFAVPSFSTSSMRMMACIGAKLRCAPETSVCCWLSAAIAAL